METERLAWFQTLDKPDPFVSELLEAYIEVAKGLEHTLRGYADLRRGNEFYEAEIKALVARLTAERNDALKERDEALAREAKLLPIVTRAGLDLSFLEDDDA